MKSSLKLIFIFWFIPLITNPANRTRIKDDTSLNLLKEQLTSEYFTRLYSNTFYNLISRIDTDGYFQESMTGQYDGEYCRTVGAMVPLLIETKYYDKAELLLKFVFQTMKKSGMNRVPHVIGKKIIHIGNQTKDSIYIIGKTDQIDGQAHNILAWARLALVRGKTSFEDSTWNFVSELMNKSTEQPYFGSSKNGFIPNLIYNFNFEHSRPIPTNYDLLTQCFVGSALNSMIKVAKRRNDINKVKVWKERLRKLINGIEKHLTRKVGNKQIYLELLQISDNKNIPFDGFSWVNLSPAAAQWQPLNYEVFKNTVLEMEKTTLQKWNNIQWLPTQSWPNGDFSGQIIGKGIGWEIEFNRQIKNWNRILQIFTMVKTIQNEEPIFMENSYLTTGTNTNLRINKDELNKMQNGVWKVVDPGNGEQAAWWCWAISRLRIELGLSAIPQKLLPSSIINVVENTQSNAKIEITNQSASSIYYSTDGSIPSKNSYKYNGSFLVEKPVKINTVAYDNLAFSNIKSLIIPSKYYSLEYSCYPNIKIENNFKWIKNPPSYTGYVNSFDIKKFSLLKNEFGIIYKGYIKINHESNYKFFIITLNHAQLFIDDKLISFDVNSLTKNRAIKSIHLEEGYHKLLLETESSQNFDNLEIYYSRNNLPKIKVDSSMLSSVKPGNNIFAPQILPFKPDFDIDEQLIINLNSLDNLPIYYTLDGSIPSKNSLRYKEPIKINSALTVKAVEIKDGQISPVSIMNYMQTENRKINLKSQPSSKYQSNGSASLIDGIYGSTNLHDGNWLGFEGDDFDATIDLRKIKELKEIKTEFLNSPGSWVFLPSSIKYFISSDGKNFENVYSNIIRYNKSALQRLRKKRL